MSKGRESEGGLPACGFPRSRSSQMTVTVNELDPQGALRESDMMSQTCRSSLELFGE